MTFNTHDLVRNKVSGYTGRLMHPSSLVTPGEFTWDVLADTGIETSWFESNMELIEHAYDPVNNPSHYTEGRIYEPLAVIEDWQLGFHLGQVVKYVSRAGRKDSEYEDLLKAQFYLNRRIDTLRPPF